MFQVHLTLSRSSVIPWSRCGRRSSGMLSGMQTSTWASHKVLQRSELLHFSKTRLHHHSLWFSGFFFIQPSADWWFSFPSNDGASFPNTVTSLYQYRYQHDSFSPLNLTCALIHQSIKRLWCLHTLCFLLVHLLSPGSFSLCLLLPLIIHLCNNWKYNIIMYFFLSFKVKFRIVSMDANFLPVERVVRFSPLVLVCHNHVPLCHLWSHFKQRTW